MTTLEQVEKLRAMADISYDEAKTALYATNGDLLEAIIYLENQGKVITPIGGGYYSSQKTTDSSTAEGMDIRLEKQNNNHNNSGNFTTLLKKVGNFCIKMIQKGNANSFAVVKGEESKVTVPVTALALLLLFAFWITIPLIIAGLFFGFRYRFHGPDFSGNTVNDAINSAADAAEDLKKSMNK